MYKNLEKVYVERFEDINRYEAMDNKLYILKEPHMRHYHKWIWNEWRERLEPLTWLDKLFEFRHAPAKLDKVDETHDYITVKNVNRTPADGLDPELFDIFQQHHLIDTSKLDGIIDDIIDDNKDLKAYKHVPAKLDKKDETHDYIVVSNENRTQADGLKEGLVDTEQQHHLIDTSKLDESIDDLDKHSHVPGRLDKTDDTHDYITVKNINREAGDLPSGLTDIYEQHYMMDTSKLDLIIDNLTENQGLEVELIGKHDPDDDTCLPLGDLTPYDELRITWASNDLSIPRAVNYFDIKNAEPISFTFSNIKDNQENYAWATGEIGQVLADVSEDLTNANICFHTSQWWRFRNFMGTAANNSYNSVDSSGVHVVAGGGQFGFATLNFPDASFGGGWITIYKITGVTYGNKSIETNLSAIVNRLQTNQYVTFKDYNKYLKYAIGSSNEQVIDILEHLERFEEEFEALDVSEGMTQKPTRYQRLLALRDKLKKGDK